MSHQDARRRRDEGTPMSNFLNEESDRFGRLAATRLQTINTGGFSDSPRPADQASSMAVIASTATSPSLDDEDAQSLPSLTLSRDSSHLSEASSIQTQDDGQPLGRLMFNPHTDERETDDGPLHFTEARVPLKCLFQYKGCVHVALDVSNWTQHTQHHFEQHRIDAPKKLLCQGCPDFKPSCWEAFMAHMATVHMPSMEKPSLLGCPKVDVAFINFLWGKHIIDDAAKKELMMNPVGPLTATPLTMTGKQRERVVTKEGGKRTVRVRDR